MARQARHEQRLIPKGIVCKNCKDGTCSRCVDVPRVMAGLYERYGALCSCKRKGHDGEPASQQILDPETGTVYAPELRVEKDGRVVRTPESGSPSPQT